MVISELIKELQIKLEQHGDLPVYHWDDWSEFLVEEVNHMEEFQGMIPHILLGQDHHGFGKRMELNDS